MKGLEKIDQAIAIFHAWTSFDQAILELKRHKEKLLMDNNTITHAYQ